MYSGVPGYRIERQKTEYLYPCCSGVHSLRQAAVLRQVLRFQYLQKEAPVTLKTGRIVAM